MRIHPTGIGCLVLAFVFAFANAGGGYWAPAQDSPAADGGARSSVAPAASDSYRYVYPFIQYDRNVLEWAEESTFPAFFEKMSQTSERKLKVLHIGDSHIQTDLFTGYIRNEFQRVFGDGGRGFIFPYAAARTHAAYDYRTSCEGFWDYARNVQRAPLYDLGVTGATAHTEDPDASFHFTFTGGTVRKEFKRVTLYLKKSPQSFDLSVMAPGLETGVLVPGYDADSKPYVSFELPEMGSEITFSMRQSNPEQVFFECYGLVLETPGDSGVLYNSVGINGAGYKSVLKENLLASHVSALAPDLVVIDLGGNDFYGTVFNTPSLEADLSQVIDMVRAGAPDVSVLVTTAQDVYKGRRNVPECYYFAQLARRVALKKGCAFYDYYAVSGGRFSMLKWREAGLAQRDRVHLTVAGYSVKGELYFKAILNSYYAHVARPENVIADLPPAAKGGGTAAGLLPRASGEPPRVKEAVPEEPQRQIRRSYRVEKVSYRVKPGDSLKKVAARYRVTVQDLTNWNKLRSARLVVGRSLVIYRKKYTFAN